MNRYKCILMVLTIICIIWIFSFIGRKLFNSTDKYIINGTVYEWNTFSNKIPDIHPIFTEFDDLYYLDQYAVLESLSDAELYDLMPEKAFSKRINVNGKNYNIHGYVFPNTESASNYFLHTTNQWTPWSPILDSLFTWQVDIKVAKYCGYQANKLIYIEAETIDNILSLFSEFNWIFKENISFSYDMDVDSWIKYIEDHSI